MNPPVHAVAFADSDLAAKGPLDEVALAVKRLVDSQDPRVLLVYDAEASLPIELDLRGSEADVLARLPKTTSPDPAASDCDETAPARRGPGRPKLGVVAREVTLLPRHWEWLASQPGGASVTLRKLVETARRQNASSDRICSARDSVYRFSSALAGNSPGYEDAMRALYANDRKGFVESTQQWPVDVRDHTRELAEAVFGSEE